MIGVRMNPLDLLTGTKDEEPLNEDEISKLKEGVHILKDKVVFDLVLSTGMDYKDLIGLRYADISITEQKIVIYDKRLKRLRAIYAPKQIFDYFKHINHSSNETPAFPFTDYMFQQIRKSWTKKCLGREVSWHVLRLTAITQAAKEGLPLELMAENSGIPPSQLFKYWKHNPEQIKKLVNGIRR